MSGVARHLEGSLITTLETWAAAHSEDLVGIKYPNKDFTPPDPDGEVAWGRCSFFPAETEQATVGDEGMNEMGGIMLVNLFWPKGKLAGPPNALGDGLVTAFKRGTICPAVSGYSAKIMKAWRDAPLEEERWHNTPIRIKWYQYVTNT